MKRTFAIATVLVASTSPGLVAAQAKAGDAWQELCATYPAFKSDFKTDQACPAAVGKALTEFLAQHPKAPEAGQARYLLGQFHYSRGEASAAAEAYWRCIDDFVKSKAAESAAFGIVRVYGAARLWDAGRRQLDRIAERLSKPEFVADLRRRFNALEHLQIGKSPLPFEVQDTDGQPLSLAQFKGKVVLLMFWATWCPHCTREIPNVTGALSQVDHREVAVLSISLDKDAATLLRYCRRVGVHWRHHCGGKRFKSDLARLYDITKIPQIFLIDRQGILRYMNSRGPLIAPRLKELVEEK